MLVSVVWVVSVLFPLLLRLSLPLRLQACKQDHNTLRARLNKTPNKLHALSPSSAVDTWVGR